MTRPSVRRQAWILLALVLSAPAASQPDTCASRTGSDATLVVPPLSASLTELGFRTSSPIWVLDGEGRCIGKGTLSKRKARAITLWGDNALTPEKDGAARDEPLRLVAETRDGELQVPLDAEWERVIAGPEDSDGLAYRAGAVYVAAELVPQRGDVAVEVRAVLEGAYDGATGAMRTRLAASGALPPSHPFGGAEFDGTALEYDVPGALAAELRDGGRVVDYVLVELRRAPDAAPAGRAPAIVLADGTVAALDGARAVPFADVVPGPYHVVVRHRSHLDVISAEPVDASSGRGAVDFTASADAALSKRGRAPSLARVAPGVFALWGGDYDGSGEPDEDDFAAYLAAFESVASGYFAPDGTLDGAVTSADLTLYLNAAHAGVESRVPDADR